MTFIRGFLVKIGKEFEASRGHCTSKQGHAENYDTPLATQRFTIIEDLEKSLTWEWH
jgi:hypothetical protein